MCSDVILFTEKCSLERRLWDLRLARVRQDPRGLFGHPDVDRNILPASPNYSSHHNHETLNKYFCFSHPHV